MTNYEHIRKMTIEEMAEDRIHLSLEEVFDYDYEENLIMSTDRFFKTSDGEEFDIYEDALEHEVDWLKREYCSEDY